MHIHSSLAGLAAWLLIAPCALARAAQDPPSAPPAVVADAGDWPIFRGDRALRGLATGSLPEQPVLRWSREIAPSIASSPVIARGLVLIGADDNNLHCLSLESGEPVWSLPTGDMIEAPPLVLGERVFVGSNDGWLYAAQLADGALAWKQETQDRILGSANWLPGKDGKADRIIVGSYDSSLYCFDAQSGERLWLYTTGDRLNGAPAMSGDQVVIGGCDTVMHVVSARTGEKVEDVPMGEGCHIAATVGIADGRAYFGHYGNAFVCVDIATGETLWSYTHPSQGFFSPPAITADAVLFGGRDKRLHCVDRATGEERWSVATRRNVDTAPVVCGDRVVFTSGDGRVRIVRLADGEEVWSYDVGKPIFSSPAVAHGQLVIAGSDGRVYAFGAARE